MKQKWPILIFSALLTAFIVLAGIWGNAQFEHLHSGSVLTAQHARPGYRAGRLAAGSPRPVALYFHGGGRHSVPHPLRHQHSGTAGP